MAIILLACGPCEVIVNCRDRFFTFCRAPRTKKTLHDFHEWCRVTRHPRVFRGLTDCQRTPGFGASHCVLTRKFSDDDFIILLLYVDDMLIIGHDSSKIDRLKRQLSKSFSMKDLGSTKHVLGMKISRYKKNKKLWLSQESYIEKVLERFNICKVKAVYSPLARHLKLISEQCPTSEKDMKEMNKVPYTFSIGSLMYAIVCTRLDIAHAVGVVSRFLTNPKKEH